MDNLSSNSAAMFDTKQFLSKHFRDLSRIRPTFVAYGIEPPEEAAIRKWAQRGNVPSNWFVLLLCLIELETGKPASLVPFLTRAK